MRAHGSRQEFVGILLDLVGAGVHTKLWFFEACKDKAQVSITSIRGCHTLEHAYCAIRICRTVRLGKTGTHAFENLKRDDHTWVPPLLTCFYETKYNQNVL